MTFKSHVALKPIYIYIYIYGLHNSKRDPSGISIFIIPTPVLLFYEEAGLRIHKASEGSRLPYLQVGLRLQHVEAETLQRAGFASCLARM